MCAAMLNELFCSIGISDDALSQLHLTMSGNDCLPSCYRTTELASSSVMVAAAALSEYEQSMLSADELKQRPVQAINVNNRLASLWFDKSLSAMDWQMSGVWDDIAGDYPCLDGWIRLHTNAPHHKKAALRILGCDAKRESVAAMLEQASADEIENTIVEANGCAATMRSWDAWQQHPQGKSVAAEPLVHWHEHGTANAANVSPARATSTKPLAGLRVLDLTRVIAGPVSTRFLAAYGADVLRIDPADWEEPSVVPEMTLGKRCAHLALDTSAGHEQFLALIKTADVLVHGYRPGAMTGLGLGEDKLLECNPALINVSLCAYGWTGPWSQRRGFDSLVQMSSGIAHQGMLAFNTSKPHPLPVQALDHATGYLMAAAVLHALAEKRKTGRILSAKLSLARTAHLLQQYPQEPLSAGFEPVTESDLNPAIENTTWGAARRVKFPVDSGGSVASWDRPATALRLFPAQWD